MTRVLNHKYFYIVLVFVLIAIGFGKGISNGLSLDDEYVINDKTESGFSSIPTLFTSKYYTHENQSHDYRPIVTISFAIEHGIFGRSNSIGHLINLIIYLFVCLAVFKFLNTLFSEQKIIIYSALVLFIVHPLHSEVVFSLKNRDELLAALFGFMACNLYLTIKDYSLKSIGLWLGVTSLFVLSILSKKTGLAFIGVAFLSQLYLSNFKFTLLKSIPFLASIITLKTINRTVHDYFGERRFYYFENPLLVESVSFFNRIPIAADIMMHYVSLFFFPHPLRYYYGYSLVELGSWSDPLSWISIIAILAMIGLSIYFWKRKSVISFGVIFFFSTILLYSNLFKPVAGIIAERLAFVPILGLCIVIGGILKLISDRYKSHYNWGIPLAILVISGAIMNFNRASDWDSRLSLFTSDMPHLKESAKANLLMARELETIDLNESNKPDYKEIAAYYSQAIKVYPKYKEALNNLAWIKLLQFNHLSEAKVLFKKAIQSDPNYSFPYHGLGRVYEYKDQVDSAIYAYRTAYSLNKRDMLNTAKYRELLIYERQKNGKALRTAAKEILADGFEFGQTYAFIGNSFSFEGQIDSALYYYDKGFQLEPSQQLGKYIYDMANKHGILSLKKKYSNFFIAK